MSTPKEKHCFTGSIQKLNPWSTKGDKPTNYPTQPSDKPAEQEASSLHTSTDPPPVPPDDLTPTTTSASSMADNANCVLWCLVDGKDTPFKIRVPINFDIGDVKELVKEKRKNGILREIDATDLVLWNMSTSM